jgi:hypothetical protein
MFNIGITAKSSFPDAFGGFCVLNKTIEILIITGVVTCGLNY